MLFSRTTSLNYNKQFYIIRFLNKSIKKIIVIVFPGKLQWNVFFFLNAKVQN